MRLNDIFNNIKFGNNFIEYYQKGVKYKKNFNDVYNDVLKAASLFTHLGIAPFNKVAIIGTNCYEWIVLDLTCVFVGAISVPLEINQDKEIEALISKYNLKVIFSNINSLIIEGIVCNFNEIYSNTHMYYGLMPYQYKDSDCFTIKFTSGTTSKKKAIKTRVKHFDDLVLHTQEMYQFNHNDKFVVFLPFSVFHQRCYIYSAILFGFNILLVPFEYLFHSIKMDNPSVLIGVPHFFESIYSSFNQKMQSSFKKRITLHAYLTVKQIAPSFFLKSGFKPFKEIFGSRMRYLLTGSAPINKKILKYYHVMGLAIYEGYGMSEVGMIGLNSPQDYKIGSVGKPFPNKEVILDNDNQILVKGDFIPNNEYYNEEKSTNEEVFLQNGYVATGDIGYLDKDGFIFIRGRIKDLIVLSNGKKVFPTLIEETLNQSKVIKNSFVFGDNKPYLTALIVPINASINYEIIMQEIKRINATLSPIEQINNFFIDNEAFSVNNGLLNSILKVNRKNILKKFGKKFENLY